MKRALCFGINNYPGVENDLSECIHDANDWAVFLQNHGFNTALYVDAMVTIANFKNYLLELFDIAVAGDYIVITYSGHGTYGVDMDNDELDGYDEALFLFDGCLYDDDIRAVIQKCPIGVHLVFILDSCFSGTATRKPKSMNTRARLHTRARFMYPYWLVGKPLPKVLAPRKKFLSNEDMIEILISGCSDKEYSYDAPALGNGAFTYYALKSMEPGQTFHEFYEKLRTYLPSDEYPQTPQLEGALGNLNQVMFESTTPVPEPEPQPESLPEPQEIAPWLLWAVPILAVVIILIVAFSHC